MRTRTHLDKITVALAVAAFALAPAALAAPRDGRSPDTRDTALAAQQHLATPADGRSPDTRDAALATRQALAVPADGRSPDTRDAARTATSTPYALVTAPVDRRSPDTTDAAIATQAPDVTTIHSPGFQWIDFGIGAVAAFSAMLILVMSIKLLAARQNRKQPSSVATA